MSARLDETLTEHRWTLQGHPVTQLCIDHSSMRVQTWSLQDSLEIRFGAPFSFRDVDGRERDIDIEAPEQAAPLLSLLSLEIRAITVNRSGEMTVEFSDLSSITIASHPQYEAFEVTGSGDLERISYLAQPGGGSPW